MPQASKELSDKMMKYFGDPVSDGGPINFLTKEEGLTLTRGFEWAHPSNKPFGDLSEKARDCLQFLVEEWDFGGYSSK